MIETIERPSIDEARKNLKRTYLLLFAEAVQKLGIKYARVEFDGQGDSGQVDDIAVYTADIPNWALNKYSADDRAAWYAAHTIDLGTPVLQFCVYDRAEFVGGEKRTIPAGYYEDTLESLLTDTACTLAEPHDWYNNDGGYGRFLYSQSKGIVFEVFIRTTTSDQVEVLEGESILDLLGEVG